MKKSLFFLFVTTVAFSQSNTEIFLYNLTNNKGKYAIADGKNISNNPGYDNQPHFYSNSSIVFSSTRDKQTDIAKYNINTGKVKYLNNTPNGSEYSPQRIPKSKDVSAVRLDTDGLQRLYRYNTKSGKSMELIANLKVAYPVWHQKNTVISVVIVGDNLDLMINELKSKKNTTIQKKVGRSLHVIPNSKYISYVSKTNEDWEIKMLNPKTGETRSIINSIGKKEDVCWLPDGTLLLAINNTLMKFNPSTDKDWSVFHTFSAKKHKNISRIIVNKYGTKLALVSE